MYEKIKIKEMEGYTVKGGKIQDLLVERVSSIILP